MADNANRMQSLMVETRKFPPTPQVQSRAYIKSFEQYEQMWEKSLKDPDGFWLEQAKTLSWFKKPTKALEYAWDTKRRTINHTWFADGELNVSYNCLDRHLNTRLPIRRRSCFRARKKITSVNLHTGNCTRRCANSPTFLKQKASKKATVYRFTCRWSPNLP